MRAFLDMDGVIVDFLKGLHKVFKIDYEYDKYPHPLGLWDMFSHMQDPEIPFEVINAACSQEFWRDLKWTTEGRRIFDAVSTAFGGCQLLTTPMPNPGSWTGKYMWVERELGPSMANNLIITTTSKDIVATPSTILIDDRDKNVEDFEAAGGYAILVPRPWNSDYKLANKTLEVVRQRIEVYV